MSRTAMRFGCATLLAVGLLAIPAASASARQSGADVVVGHYTLKLTPQEGVSMSVDLSCSPNGGSHPSPDAACVDLDAADGHITDIEPEAGACTKEYAPVVAIARGSWDGGSRVYRKEFGNACEAVQETGGDVFDFA